MAEFKLICPGCGAEYMLPPDAIPPAGREVECSACGHVWQAHRPAPARLDLADFSQGPDDLRFDEDADNRPAPALPPASQRLPASVLDILRDEADHERRLRQAEQAPAPSDDIDWPATTVTAPVTEPRTPRAPTVIRHAAPRSVMPAPDQVEVPAPVADPVPTSPAPHRADAPSPKPRSTDYAKGFVLGLALAAGVVAVYLIAPVMEPHGGPLARMLTDGRDGLDSARLWLSQTVGQ